MRLKPPLSVRLSAWFWILNGVIGLILMVIALIGLAVETIGTSEEFGWGAVIFAALVTLRRTETADGDDIDAIVNRAEAAANAGDLPGAVAALGALDGDPAKVAQPWIAEAQARIAVDRAVRSLQSRALATLSGG